MKLLNPERAVIDEAKLRDYCLSGTHIRGRHKARMFAAVLGITDEHVDILRSALQQAVIDTEVIPGELDEYGQRFVLDFEMGGPAGRGFVHSTWIVRGNEDFARLVTCYVLRRA
jgi:hypothetical protein